jgi:zinc D-Ala-D-Ala dipeptidase
MTAHPQESSVVESNTEPLVDLAEYDFVLEPAYYNQGLTDESRMFLRKGVADKLAHTQAALGGYRFKIWDGYRPRVLQNKIFERTKEEFQHMHPEWDGTTLDQHTATYVADGRKPEHIPAHSTGGAVDLTLVDSEGKELDMGTGFDHFGPEAAPFYFDTGDHMVAAAHRRLLRDALSAEAFVVYPEEWWHFDFGTERWARECKQPRALYGEVLVGA